MESCDWLIFTHFVTLRVDWFNPKMECCDWSKIVRWSKIGVWGTRNVPDSLKWVIVGVIAIDTNAIPHIGIQRSIIPPRFGVGGDSHWLNMEPHDRGSRVIATSPSRWFWALFPRFPLLQPILPSHLIAREFNPLFLEASLLHLLLEWPPFVCQGELGRAYCRAPSPFTTCWLSFGSRGWSSLLYWYKLPC